MLRGLAGHLPVCPMIDNDRCDECMDGRHENCTDIEDESCCCPPGPDRRYFPVPMDEDLPTSPR